MSKVAKATVGLMIVTILAKIVGFGRDQVLSYIYGAGMYTDIYFVTINIPNVIFAAIGAALATTFIPLYCDINTNFGEEKANKFTNNILSIVLCLCIVIVTLGLVFTEPVLKIFAVGFEGERLAIGIKFTRILISSIVFIGISNVLTAYLQVKNNFTIPGLISLPQNIIVIISIFLSVKYGPYSIVWGTLIGMASQVILQLPFAYREGFRLKPHIDFKDNYLKKMVILTGPVFIGVAVNQINIMVDKNLASILPYGSISALNYADRLNNFILALFITSIVAVLYPILSKLSHNDNQEKFAEYIVKSCNNIILLVIPISVGAIALSTPIVKLLFERGAFDSKATSMTAIALAMYSIGLVAYGLREIISKVFYSLQDTKTPMINGAIAMGLNVVLNLALVKIMGHAGLALATSISALICTFLLFRSLKKKIGDFGQIKILQTTIKSLIASITMGACTYLGYNFIVKILESGFVQQVISIGVSVLIGVIVYGLLAVILKIEEIFIIIDMNKKRIQK
jgi:putative peptidoglycan lipid II flippase